MQDRPTAAELLQAAREFCERDLLPNLKGRVGFHARVLANVLAILEREWEAEEGAVREEWEHLRALLGAEDEPPPSFSEMRGRVREWNVELARRIRSGSLDERRGELLDRLKTVVERKLAIANPRWTEGG